MPEDQVDGHHPLYQRGRLDGIAEIHRLLRTARDAEDIVLAIANWCEPDNEGDVTLFSNEQGINRLWHRIRAVAQAIRSQQKLPDPAVPTTHKMLELSTSHVTRETAWVLDTGKWCYVKGDYGWFVHVPDPSDESEAMPDDLRWILAYAREVGCHWIMFDRDADPIDELPSYDW